MKLIKIKLIAEQGLKPEHGPSGLNLDAGKTNTFRESENVNKNRGNTQ